MPHVFFFIFYQNSKAPYRGNVLGSEDLSKRSQISNKKARIPKTHAHSAGLFYITTRASYFAVERALHSMYVSISHDHRAFIRSKPAVKDGSTVLISKREGLPTASLMPIVPWTTTKVRPLFHSMCIHLFMLLSNKPISATLLKLRSEILDA